MAYSLDNIGCKSYSLRKKDGDVPMNQIYFEKDIIYTENEIFNLVREQKKDISEQKFKWTLFELVQNGLLCRIGTKRYIAGLKKYKCELSDIGMSLNEYIKSTFPEVNYTIWESIQLNEWVNLLLNQNTVFIDVEKELLDFVVDSLMDAFGKDYTILVNPDENTVARYRRNNLIIVKKLYSRSPMDRKCREIKLEKLLVDLLCDKNYLSMLDYSAVEDIFEGVKLNYAIDSTKMLNYAKRRGILDRIKKIWSKN